MSFRISFVGYDHNRMISALGTGDQSTIEAIIKASSQQYPDLGPDPKTIELAKTLAINVVQNGFPSKLDSPEDAEHQLAAEWLALAFRLPDGVVASAWRWSAFYDTLHTVPGFEEPIQEIIDYLDEGRPWFGTECQYEFYYGHLTSSESHAVYSQCQNHLSEFKAHDEAIACIDDVMGVFKYGSEIDGNLWFAVN